MGMFLKVSLQMMRLMDTESTNIRTEQYTKDIGWLISRKGWAQKLGQMEPNMKEFIKMDSKMVNK